MTHEYECGCQFTNEELQTIRRLPNNWPVPATCPIHSAPGGIMTPQVTPRAGAQDVNALNRQMRQAITEIIEELERHVEKFGGEEVTENFGTRDLLTALKAVSEGS